MAMMSVSNSANKIKVSIIEDSEIHSEWLMAVLEASSDFEIVSVDQTAKSGLQSARQLSPDVVVLDFQLDDMTGLEAAKRLHAFNEQIKFLSLLRIQKFRLLNA